MSAPISPALVRAAMSDEINDEVFAAYKGAGMRSCHDAHILRDHIRAVTAEMRQEAKEWRTIFKMAAKLADDPGVYDAKCVAYVEALVRFADKLEGEE